MNLFKNRTVVGVFCILLSLLICFGVTPLFNSAVSEKAEIVRVVKEIKAGDEITADMVQTAEVGGYGLPDNVIRQTDTVVGKYAAADLSIGDYILSTKLTDMMGYRSVRDMIALELGWLVSDPSVWKSMRRLKIHGYTRRRKNQSVGSGMEHMRYTNLLRRDFTAASPLQKVVTDVTYIKFNGKWFYLAAYLDLYNNEILEWELSDTFDNFLVMKPAERLLKKAESTEHQVLLHSDQGVQYSSAGFCNLLTKYNAIQSMSRAGTPHDNAVMESFWGRFKDALCKHFRYWEKDNLYDVVAQCVHYFNYIRPVRKLNGKPPVLFRTELVA